MVGGWLPEPRRDQKPGISSPISHLPNRGRLEMERISLCLYSQVALVVKNPPDNARDMDSIPGSRRSYGGVEWPPTPVPLSENPWTEEVGQATVPGVSESDNATGMRL